VKDLKQFLFPILVLYSGFAPRGYRNESLLDGVIYVELVLKKGLANGNIEMYIQLSSHAGRVC